jgi:preprotein translocase subunit YajC
VNELGLLVWVLLAVGFYFLFIRPARMRQRQALEIQNSLRPGLEVMTTAGLYATVSSIEDDVVLLEVAPGVVNRYAKGAVARVITPAEAEPEDAKPDGTDGDPAAG